MSASVSDDLIRRVMSFKGYHIVRNSAGGFDILSPVVSSTRADGVAEYASGGNVVGRGATPDTAWRNAHENLLARGLQ